MKNNTNFFRNTVATLFAGVFFCFTLLSCENFLNAGNVSEEIKDVIAYNNAKNINVSIECKEDMGTIFPQPTFQSKLGYSFEIQFIPNTDNYIIRDPAAILKAVSRIDKTQSRADCVKFSVLEQSFEDKKSGIYRINVTVVKDADDILIQPDCIELPYVKAVYPSLENGNVAANTVITVDFNMSVEHSNVLDKLMLLLSKDNSDIGSYFETPYLNESKTQIIIEPKPKALQKYITDVAKAAFVEIAINLEDNVVFNNGDLKMPLSAQGGKVFKMRFKPELETDAPTNHGFYVFTSKDTFNVKAARAYKGSKFATDELDIDNFDNDKILQNRTSGTVYIYGKYFDADSGVKTITLTETRTNDKNGDAVSEDPIGPVFYTASDIEFLTDDSGYTEFCIPYTLQSPDGAILLTIGAIDGCTNTSAKENKSVVVVKDSGMDLSDLILNNSPSNLTKLFFIEKTTWVNEETEEEDLYWDWDNDDYVNPINLNRKVVYKDLIIPSEQISFVIEYKDNNNVTSYVTLEKEVKEYVEWKWNGAIGDYSIPLKDYLWTATLTNFDEDKIAEKQIKLIVTDDAGNVTERIFSFPSQPKVARIEKKSNYYFYFTRRGTNDKVYLERDENGYISVYQAGENAAALNGPSGSTGIFTASFIREGLYGKKTEPFEIQDFSDLPVLSDVEVTDISYDKTTVQGLIDVTISVAEDSWDKYDDIYYICDGFRGESREAIRGAIHFNKDSLTSTFTTLTGDLFSAAQYSFYYITVFGVKDDSMSAGKKEYPKLTDFSYDDVDPSLYAFSTDASSPNPYYTVKSFCTENEGEDDETIDYLKLYSSVIACKASDGETGIDYITIKTSETTKEIKYTAEDYYYNGLFIIPFWDLNGTDSCRITVYDKAGNSTSEDIVVEFINTPKPAYSNPAKIFGFSTSNLSEGAKKWDYTYFKWNDGEWEEVWNLRKDYASVTSFDGYAYSTVPTVANDEFITTNSMYKVIVKFENKDENHPNYGITYPAYYWSGNNSSGNRDYIIPKTNRSVLISSDSAVFVQTLVTQRPYSECKDWSIDEWQTRRTSIDEKILYCSESITTLKYDIPVEDKINKGECYVVVAHFANGSTDISEVFQK